VYKLDVAITLDLCIYLVSAKTWTLTLFPPFGNGLCC
jgi:hypothetical protein